MGRRRSREPTRDYNEFGDSLLWNLEDKSCNAKPGMLLKHHSSIDVRISGHANKAEEGNKSERISC